MLCLKAVKHLTRFPTFRKRSRREVVFCFLMGTLLFFCAQPSPAAPPTHTFTPTPTLTSTPTAVITGCSDWALVGGATSGSAVTLTPDSASVFGAAWNKSCIDLSQDFNMTFKAYYGSNSCPTWAGADGNDFVLQNDSRGIAAISASTSGGDKAYSGPSSITPSIALCLETYGSNGTLQPQENGNTTSTCAFDTGT